jgi:hypothetical protein
LAKVRDALRVRLGEVISTYSFTEEEREEAARNGIQLTPKHAVVPEGSDLAADVAFDEAIGEIYHRQMELRRLDQAARLQ